MKLHQNSKVIGATLGHVPAPLFVVQNLQGTITSSSPQISRKKTIQARHEVRRFFWPSPFVSEGEFVQNTGLAHYCVDATTSPDGSSRDSLLGATDVVLGVEQPEVGCEIGETASSG